MSEPVENLVVADAYVHNVNRSYMIGRHDPDWGERTYFTFFGEFQQTSVVRTSLEVVILALIYLVATSTNVLVVVMLARSKKQRHTGNNYCVANLAVAGITYSSCLPLVMATRVTQTWVFGRVLCGFTVYTMYCGAILTVWTMAVISIDRYRCTQKKGPLSCNRVLVLVAVMWLVALLASVPLAYYFVLRGFVVGSEEVVVCTLVWPNTAARLSILFTAPSVLILFFLPLIVIVVNYTRVTKTLTRSMEKFKHDDGSKSSGFFSARIFRKQKEMRVVRLLILLVVVFCVMWLPVAICFVMMLWDGLFDTLVMTSQLYLAGMTTAISNACVNPFIYAFVNDSCKTGLRRLVSGLPAWCRCRSAAIGPDLGGSRDTEGVSVTGSTLM